MQWEEAFVIPTLGTTSVRVVANTFPILVNVPTLIVVDSDTVAVAGTGSVAVTFDLPNLVVTAGERSGADTVS